MLNRSIAESWRCLNLLAATARPMGIREMGRALALDSAKVTRIMQALLAQDLVQQNAQRKYAPGLGLHRLSALAMHNSSFYQAVVEMLEEVGEHHISIVIGVLNGPEVVYLFHTRNGMSAARALGNYHAVPVKDSVIGIKLLAAKSDEEIITLLGIHDFRLLLPEIRNARQQQIYIKSYDGSQYRLACAIAGTQAVAALSNLSCAPEALERYKTFLRALVSKISHQPA